MVIRFLVLDSVRGFEQLLASGELPAGRYIRSRAQYITEAGTVYQLARNLDRTRGLPRSTIVLAHNSRNPLSRDEMREVMAWFDTVQFYGESASAI